MGLVSDIMLTVDDGVKTAGEQFFNATAGGMTPVMTVLTTILLLLVGVNMAVGYYALSVKDTIQLATRICLVYLFAFSWSNFSLLYDALTTASQDLAITFFKIAASTDGSTTYTAMDKFAVQMSDTADGVARAQGSWTRGLVAGALYLVLAVLMAIYVLIVAYSKIMIAFLLGVAPLAMVLTIFERTKNLFEAWLSSFVGYLMYPIAASAVLSAIVKVAQVQFTEQERVENISQILGFLVVVFVGIFALKAIPQAASNITGNFNLATIAPEALRLTQKTGGMIGRHMPGAGKIRDLGTMAQGFKQGSGYSPDAAKRLHDRTIRERGAKIRERISAKRLLRGETT